MPILLLSRPLYGIRDDDPRTQVILDTYRQALDAGDRNVLFVSGAELMRLGGYDGTVDNCHPTDLGFYSMATVIADRAGKFLLEK